MGQWSEPKKDIHRYATPSGGEVVLTMTFVDHLATPPFVEAKADAQVDHRELVNG